MVVEATTMYKSSTSFRLVLAGFAFFASQIILTGYYWSPRALQAPPEKKTKIGGTGLNKKLKVCSSQGFYSLSDRKGNRHLVVCNTPDCSKESFRLKLNKKALWEINNSLRYSKDSISTTMISAILDLSPRASGYVLATDLQAKILLVDNQKSMVGDVLKNKSLRISNGRTLRGNGERWRDCQAFNHFTNAVKGLTYEVRSRGPKALSGHKFLDRLDIKLRQAQLATQNW